MFKKSECSKCPLLAAMQAGCQSLAPFTDHVVNHFLVQTVPFHLDKLAQLFHICDPVVVVHTLVGSPTPCSQWGSALTVWRPGRLSYQDCEPCTTDRTGKERADKVAWAED